MQRTLKGVFNEVGASVKFDRNLAKRIRKYVNSFVTKTADSINFFGDALIGVYPVKYTTEDRNMWFDEILDIDEFTLRSEVYSLPTIDPIQRKVASDLVNNSFIWCLHRFNSSTELSDTDKERVMVDILAMMHYKFLSSLMSHYFKYPADKSVALATYATLSKKFLLKVHGSWSALVKFRAEDIISKDGIHANTIINYDDDEKIGYMIGDIQSRIREVVKAIMDVFYQVRESDGRISASSSLIDIEGESVVKDKRNDYIRFRKYINSVVSDERGFIKEELVGLIGKTIHTLPTKHLEEVLEYCSNNYKARGETYIEDLLDKTVIHAFEYLQRNKIKLNDLSSVLVNLRAIYMSSRSNEPSLVEIRTLADKLVDVSVSSRNAPVKASVRTGLLLYVVLRTLAMKHYN